MTWQWLLLIFSSITTLTIGVAVFTRLKNNQNAHSQQASEANRQLLVLQEKLNALESQRENLQQLLKEQRQEQQEQRTKFDSHQLKTLRMIQDSLQTGMQNVREEVGKKVDKLTTETSQRLKEISGEVDKQLSQGFAKTTETFANVMKRLTIIDQAQQKITELSSSVVSLQEVLTDRKTRGAFGEVQLSALIRNMIPEAHFSMQHTLSNGKRPDCILFLPEPTGNVAIDAKFPLETFRILMDMNISPEERKKAEQTFRIDIRHHIQQITEKYIIPGETSDGAIMFIPAESIFAEIHANFPELVEEAQKARVWLVSPTTLMAILTTARAVLKDAATRKQVHIIQEHLVLLSKDFERFQARMDNLARHISLAHDDVSKVHTSSRKISERFNRIEKLELEEDSDEKLELPSTHEDSL